MRILLTAPANEIGRRVLRELLAPEFSVRVLVRDPACLSPGIRRQVQIIPGSPGDARTLRPALDGAEAVFWHVPADWFQAGDVIEPYESFARAGAFAIRRAGTPRIVSISEGRQGISLENILNESGAAIRHLRYAGADITEITDVALRWLVRRDWKGIESVPVPAAGNVRKYGYVTEEIL